MCSARWTLEESGARREFLSAEMSAVYLINNQRALPGAKNDCDSGLPPLTLLGLLVLTDLWEESWTITSKPGLQRTFVFIQFINT